MATGSSGMSKWPTARFELHDLTADVDRLAFGRSVSADVTGTFAMKGHAVPLAFRVQLEPILAADDSVRLGITGGFELRLREPFGLAGPDGPAPANDTLRFDVAFELVPDGGATRSASPSKG